jgi:hypothetical protein
VADAVREGASGWIEVDVLVDHVPVILRVGADTGAGFELMRLEVADAASGFEDEDGPDKEAERIKGAVRVNEAAEERDEATGDDDGVSLNDGTGPGVFV